MKSVTTYWRLETGDTRSDWFRSILDTGSYLPVHSYPSTTSYICPYTTIAELQHVMSNHCYRLDWVSFLCQVGKFAKIQENLKSCVGAFYVGFLIKTENQFVCNLLQFFISRLKENANKSEWCHFNCILGSFIRVETNCNKEKLK